MKLACLASFLFLAAGRGETPPSRATEGSLPLPPPSGALVFEPETEQMAAADLLGELARLTGQELAMSAQARVQLAQAKVVLESGAPVPREEVYTFVEGLLVHQGVLLAPLTGGTRPILGVQMVGGGRDPQLLPLYVSLDARNELARHPALHVRLLLGFQHIDSRQVQTQLRQLLVDNAGTTQCVPVGDRGLILQGRASEMASLAQLLLDADAAAGRLAPLPQYEASPTKGE